MSTITWLHISDLHWRESQEYSANIVLTALLHDLARREEHIASELSKIDFIIVTGDVAFAGRPEEYTLARQFFKQLGRTTGVHKSRIFIVPGNHDVDRDAITEDAQKIADTLISRDAVNRFLDNKVARAVVFHRFHHYRRFVNDYFGRYLAFDSVHYFYVRNLDGIAGKRIAILGLNSAWFSTSDTDRNRLILGERQVRAALDRLKNADVRIVVMHHPFEWLNDFDRDDCEPLLLRGCDFVLHGHLHRSELMRLQAPGIEAMVIAAGACYKTRQYPNAYNLVHLDLGASTGTVYLRTYSDRQGGFWTKDWLTYPEVPGKYCFNLPNRWADREVLKPARAGRSSALDKWWQRRGYGGDPFVAPNAEDGDVQQLRDWHINCLSLADRRKRRIDTLDAVIREGDSGLVLIFAPSGGGKTFYRRLATHWCQEEIKSRGALGVSAPDLHRARVLSPEGLSAHRLAVCIHEKIFAHHPQRSSLIDTGLSNAEGEPGYVLSHCATLATSFNPERGPAKLYIYLDDLDKIFYRLSEDKRESALTAIADFLGSVAGGTCGELVAIRVFLPLVLDEPIQQVLNSRLRERIWQEKLLWTLEGCMEVAERRLDTAWSSQTKPRVGHLTYLLSQDAVDLLRQGLRKRERRRNLSPRDVIKMLSSAASCAAGEDVKKDEPITGEVFLRSQESRWVRAKLRFFRKP